MYNLGVYTPELTKLKPNFCYHKGDYVAINNHLKNVDWTERLQDRNAEEAWLYFPTEFSNAINTYIPNSRLKTDKRREIWMNGAAMAKQKKKYNAWKLYTQTGDYIDYVRATQEKNELKEMTRNMCREFEKDIAKNIKTDPKVFWWYTNQS